MPEGNEMPQWVFFDTHIITKASDGRIGHEVWTRLTEAIEQKYEYRVSFTTLFELLNALAGGDEQHFEENRKRLVVLADVPGCEFLPLPGQFIRDVVFGLPVESAGFSPNAFQRLWIPLIKTARDKSELSGGIAMGAYDAGINLGMVRKQMENGQDLWIEQLRHAKDSGKQMPPREIYAEFLLQFDVKAAVTRETIQKLGAALDAAFCHLSQIHHESTRSNYNFEKNRQDWVDNNQLMYLADPNSIFVTDDARLAAKVRKSTQRVRVREFSDFVTNN
jgi:hypothetical protein